MDNKFPMLLSPYTIRGFTFKNRMLAAPFGTPKQSQNEGGYMSEDLLAYYEEIAKGGTARVCTTDNPVDATYAGFNGQWRYPFYKKYDNTMRKFRDSMTEYINICHRHGALAFVEFTHQGSYSVIYKEYPNAPDHVLGPIDGIRDDGMPIKAMTAQDIEKTCLDFAYCCRKAKRMGFDGCVIHGGHGWLIGQFLAPDNTRSDEFGGSFENRIRFPLAILQKIREFVGENFLIELRLSGEEFRPNGITLNETVEFSKRIDGLVDLIHISAGVHKVDVLNLRTFAGAFLPNACNAYMSEEVKKVVKKSAVVLVGGITDPYTAEEVLEKGQADFVCLGRQIMVADPYFPKKVQMGCPEDIDTCVRCLKCIFGCTVNPIGAHNFSERVRLRKADTSKKVVVIGGGPGGMKAALCAAECGNQVVLFEETASLGGALKFTDYDSYKHDLSRYKNNLISRVENSSIDVRLNTAATVENVSSEQPFAVIIAAGATPKIPKIEGVSRKNVFTPLEAYRHQEQLGGKVVILGGGLTGCEIGLHLKRIGKDVSVLKRTAPLAADESVSMWHKLGLMEEIKSTDLKTYVGYNTTSINDSTVTVVDPDGQTIEIPADSVILCTGMQSNHEIVEELHNIAPLVYPIGDCVAPRSVKEAVNEAYFAVYDINS